MITHVVFGAPAAGNLKKYIGTNPHLFGRIIHFNDDLSIGPIDELEDFYSRQEWWLSIVPDSEYLTAEEHVNCFNDYGSLEKLNQISGQVIFWIGPNAIDELGFLWLLSNMTDLNEKYIIKFKNIILDSSRPNEVARSLGEAGPDKVADLIKLKKPITVSMQKQLLPKWQKITQSGAFVRSRVSEFTYLSQKEEYFDKSLVKFLSKDLQPAGKVIGSFYKFSKDLVNLNYILWRIREMVEEKQIEFEGDLNSIRNLKIRLASSKGL